MAHGQPVGTETDATECALCRRSLLVGESLRVFRDREDRDHGVCELCVDRASRRGLRAVGSQAPQRLSVRPGSEIDELVSRDSVRQEKGRKLAYLKRQIGDAEATLADDSIEGDALTAITDRLHRQELELERLRREADPMRLHQLERELERSEAAVRELKEQVADRDRRLEALESARRLENDPVAMLRSAVDVFNMSEHVDRMARIARTLDDPEVCVVDHGMGLPRVVHITLVWEIAWYAFDVKLDVGRGRASVHETASGGDPSTLPDTQRVTNARWRESGLVLA